jgi:hypothetical protein
MSDITNISDNLVDKDQFWRQGIDCLAHHQTQRTYLESMKINAIALVEKMVASDLLTAVGYQSREGKIAAGGLGFVFGIMFEAVFRSELTKLASKVKVYRGRPCQYYLRWLSNQTLDMSCNLLGSGHKELSERRSPPKTVSRQSDAVGNAQCFPLWPYKIKE